MNGISKTISYFGNMRKMADAIGVSSPTIIGWRNKGSLPVKRCVQIEQATGGQVTRRDLRPDDWHEIWPELKD